ncbi:MAG: hypothetical protein J6332_05560 [Abditibacteriota bacterium]|nr:hypothetical protein [Abditibacteriota bacterium]
MKKLLPFILILLVSASAFAAEESEIRTLHVISHTHWDREWYLPFQNFRMRLVDAVDKLLDILDNDPTYTSFNFDGQTIVLEDYLEIHPEKEAKLAKYIKEGRIIVGPWYQLCDEYLVSGESLVRTLLVGHQIAEKYGKPMKVGYLADNFGNVSQMPQILRGFDIDCCIFGRGRDCRGENKMMEFIWRSPDGSEVFTSQLAFWYNNAERFPFGTDEAVKYTENLVKKMAPYSAVDALLLMNGVDHFEVQKTLPDIIRRVNPKLKNYKLVQSTLADYIKDAKDYVEKNKVELEVVDTEMRHDRATAYGLSGTLTSRLYLKRANAECQTLIEKQTEPLQTFCYMLGEEYPGDYMMYLWKLLMHNHPHDSICGCSVDAVHDQMMTRFAETNQVAEDLRDRALVKIASRIDVEGENIMVYNAMAVPVTDYVSAPVDMAPFEGGADFVITDPDGNKVNAVIEDWGDHQNPVLHGERLPKSTPVRRIHVDFLAENVPPCGYKVYKIEKGKSAPAGENLGHDTIIENEYLRLAWDGKGLNLARLENGKVMKEYKDIAKYEDWGDCGDEYAVGIIEGSRVVGMTDVKAFITTNNPVAATLRVEGSLRVPEKMIDEKTRSENVVDCIIYTDYTIHKGVPRVDVKVKLFNNARDHRIRVLFPTDLKTSVSHSGGKFDVVTRPMEPPFELCPMDKWVDLNDRKEGLCIITKGLPEYEIYKNENNTIAVTLLRSIDRLGVVGSPTVSGALCMGMQDMEYSIYPHGGDCNDASVWRQGELFNAPLTAYKIGGNTRGEDMNDIVGEDPSKRIVPEKTLGKAHSFVNFEGDVVVTAVKKSDRSDMVVVRFWNPLDREQKYVSVTVPGAKSARMLNLNEESMGDMPCEKGKTTFSVGAREIVTLGFEVKK